MNIIGLTGKSGSGKSYFSNMLGEQLGNSNVINFDNIFSEVMNSEDTISKIYDIYGDDAIKNGQVDLDTILMNKEMFNTIYNMIIKEIEARVRQEIAQSGAERKRKRNIGLVGFTEVRYYK